MLHVIAVITAQPGKRQAILDELLPRIPEIEAEPGHIEYTVTTDADVVGAMHTQTRFGPDTYVVIEKWRELKDLENHSTAPFVKEFLEKVEPLMASRVVHFLAT